MNLTKEQKAIVLLLESVSNTLGGDTSVIEAMNAWLKKNMGENWKVMEVDHV